MIQPKQRYMELSEIFASYKTRAVAAYGCKLSGGVPEGGFVIAVSDSCDDPGDIKDFTRDFKKKYRDKAPVFYIRVTGRLPDGRFKLIYDDGSGEKEYLPEIKAKKSGKQTAVEDLPYEEIAKAL